LEPGPPNSVIPLVNPIQVNFPPATRPGEDTMRITRIDIKRDDCILQVENWPSVDKNVTVHAELSTPVVSGEVELSIVGDSLVSVITPVCQDGVCQLGEWKPRKTA